MKIKIFIALSTCLLLLIGCGGAHTNDPLEKNVDSLSLALEETVNKVIIPTVDQFSQQSQHFKDSSDTFCNTPNTSHLTQLQQSWKSLSKQWYKLAIYNFGPVNDDLIFPKINFIDSLRQRGINYTETVRTEITADLNNTADLNANYFSAKDFNRVGILALELLSFETAGNNHSKQAQEILDEYVSTPRKCELLKGLSNFHLNIAKYIKNGWNTAHLSTGKPYKTLFLTNTLANDDKPITVLITSIETHLDYLAKRNIATVGAQVANYSYENISSSIAEIKAVLQGGEQAKASIYDIMSSSEDKISVAIVKSNIAAIETSLQNKNSIQLKSNLGLLNGNFKLEIPSALNIELGINFTDGD